MAVDLKKILGEAYTPELEEQIFAEAKKESARLKAALDGLNQDVKAKEAKLKEIETASLSEQERLQKQAEESIAAAKQMETQYKAAMAKVAAQKVLRDFPVDEEVIGFIAGNDPESAEAKASKFLAVLQAARTAGETSANEQHLKNNGAPQGNAHSGGMTQADFDKLPVTAQMQMAIEKPEVYKQFTGG